jgi:uncharacterized protein
MSSLASLAYTPLPLAAIKPAGWLARQLRIQADGLTGHLDEFWPDIRDSGWIGGDKEGWERAPYWLDGLVPLAFLLDDSALLEKVHRWINHIIDHQQPDGWLGPVMAKRGPNPAKDKYDAWPMAIILKVLRQYHEATGEKRVLDAMLKAARGVGNLIDQYPISSWARYRWMDLAWCLHGLFDLTGESWLLDVAAKLHAQGFDWRANFEQFKYPGKIDAARLKAMADKDGPDHDPDGYHATHVVNNAMGLKQPAVWSRHSNQRPDRDAVYQMLDTLDRHHGQAHGLFSGDEHLAGNMPSQGTETCAVVEAMFSLEVLLSILGEPALADRLERIAFNALPAAFKPDMWARQYVQQPNQIECGRFEDRLYTNNGPDANMYGLETHFGCCTANMHQGWPKFTSHLWMKTPDDGLAALAYAPCVIRTTCGSTPVQIEVETLYPFDGVVAVHIEVDKPATFPIELRIPQWAAAATVQIGDEEPRPAGAGRMHRIEQQWTGRTTIELVLPMRWRVERRFNQSVTLLCGPLVFALNIEDHWEQVDGQLPHATWHTRPASPWNYALAIAPHTEVLERSVTIEQADIGDCPFSPHGAPLRASVPVKALPAWTVAHHAAAPPPLSPLRVVSRVERADFLPYGCTNLRITELPLAAGP